MTSYASVSELEHVGQLVHLISITCSENDGATALLELINDRSKKGDMGRII
jgi:hypothetical protein